MQRTLMILVSGAGTTLECLASKIRHEMLDARICCVVGNHASIRAADVANKYDLAYWTFDPKIYPCQDDWDGAFHDLVAVYKPALVVLAGFDMLVKIPPQYEGRVVSVHPSLLPKYGGKGMYGDRVHQAVLRNREEITGCTVYACTAELGGGAILTSRSVLVDQGETVDSLRAKVQKAEREILPRAIDDLLDAWVAKEAD